MHRKPFFIFSNSKTDQTHFLCCVKSSADCVNTSEGSSRRIGDMEKQKRYCASVTQWEKESEAWINTSILRLCITHPLTVKHTHLLAISLKQTHSIPLPAAGHTSAQDYQISSWRFGSPDRACVWRGLNLGHLDGNVVWSRQDCFVIGALDNSLSTCSMMLPCHRQHHSCWHLPSSRPCFLCQSPSPTYSFCSFWLCKSFTNTHAHKYTHSTQTHTHINTPHPISLW